MSHIPVLLKEVLEYLGVKPGGKYIDATFGSGGHSREIVKRGGTVLGIDRDPGNVKVQISNVKTILGNFADIGEIARENGFDEADGILFDLGLSSEQLDDPARGFSFQQDGPLDMRMHVEKSQIPNHKSQTAADIINLAPEKELVKIFYDFGEERRFGKRVARAIVDVRKRGGLKASATPEDNVAETFRFPISSTAQLFDIIKRALPANLRFRAGDTARRIFQALRIAVNRELENLEQALPQAVALLKKPINGQATGSVPRRFIGKEGGQSIHRLGGRLVVISFHSLEDRIVKKFMAEAARGCICPPEFPVCRCGHNPALKILTKKPVTAGEEEIKQNPRSQSAKLRCAERI